MRILCVSFHGRNPCTQSSMMHYYTRQKIRLIRKYLRSHGKELSNAYDGVNGIYVARKIRKGKTLNRYCIVFNVRAKKAPAEVQALIPKYLRLRIRIRGKNVVYTLPTDVRQVGAPKLQRCQASSEGGGMRSDGTVTGFIVRNNKTYYLSNMHVLGYPYLRHGKFEVDEDEDDLNVRIEGKKVCAFRKGILEDNGELDVAMAEELKNPPVCQQQPFDLDDFDLIPEKDLELVMNDPILINSYGHINDTQGKASITNHLPGPVDFDFEGQTISLFNLLQITPPISVHEDSGSLIYDDADNAYGILVGGDDAHTYAINLDKCIEYLFD